MLSSTKEFAILLRRCAKRQARHEFGASLGRRKKPSKPPDCRSRRCRRRFPRWRTITEPGFDALQPRRLRRVGRRPNDEDVEFLDLAETPDTGTYVAAMPEYGHGSPSCREAWGEGDSGSRPRSITQGDDTSRRRYARARSWARKRPQGSNDRCTSSCVIGTKGLFGQGGSSTETTPSKPPGCGSRPGPRTDALGPEVSVGSPGARPSPKASGAGPRGGCRVSLRNTQNEMSWRACGCGRTSTWMWTTIASSSW